jgi:hypothetical protein
MRTQCREQLRNRMVVLASSISDRAGSVLVELSCTDVGNGPLVNIQLDVSLDAANHGCGGAGNLPADAMLLNATGAPQLRPRQDPPLLKVAPANAPRTITAFDAAETVKGAQPAVNRLALRRPSCVRLHRPRRLRCRSSMHRCLHR